MSFGSLVYQLTGYLRGSKRVFTNELLDDTTKIPEAIELLLKVLESKGDGCLAEEPEEDIVRIVDQLDKGSTEMDISARQAFIILKHYLKEWTNPIISYTHFMIEEKSINVLMSGDPFYSKFVALGHRLIHKLATPRMVLLGRTIRVVENAMTESKLNENNKQIFRAYLTPCFIRDPKNIGRDSTEEEIFAVHVLMRYHVEIFTSFLDAYPIKNSDLTYQFWTPQIWVAQHGASLREFIDNFRGVVTKRSVMEGLNLTDEKINDVFSFLKESQPDWSVYDDIVMRPWNSDEIDTLLDVLLETGGYPEYIVEKIPTRTIPQIQKKLELIAKNSVNRLILKNTMEGNMNWDNVEGLQATIASLVSDKVKKAAIRKEIEKSVKKSRILLAQDFHTTQERNKQILTLYETEQQKTRDSFAEMTVAHEREHMAVLERIYSVTPVANSSALTRSADGTAETPVRAIATPTPLSVTLATPSSSLAPVLSQASTVSVPRVVPTTPMSMIPATPVSLSVDAAPAPKRLDHVVPIKFRLDEDADEELDANNNNSVTATPKKEKRTASSSNSRNASTPKSTRITRSSNQKAPKSPKDQLEKPKKPSTRKTPALTSEQKAISIYLDETYKLNELRNLWSTFTGGQPILTKFEHKPQLIRQLVINGYVPPQNEL